MSRAANPTVPMMRLWSLFLLFCALGLSGCGTFEGVMGPKADLPAPRAEAEPFPDLNSVPPRPALGYDVAQRREVVANLANDRANARYDAEAIRRYQGRRGLDVPPLPATVGDVVLPPPGPAERTPSAEAPPELRQNLDDDGLDNLLDAIVEPEEPFGSEPQRIAPATPPQAERQTDPGEAPRAVTPTDVVIATAPTVAAEASPPAPAQAITAAPTAVPASQAAEPAAPRPTVEPAQPAVAAAPPPQPRIAAARAPDAPPRVIEPAAGQPAGAAIAPTEPGLLARAVDRDEDRLVPTAPALAAATVGDDEIITALDVPDVPLVEEPLARIDYLPNSTRIAENSLATLSAVSLAMRRDGGRLRIIADGDGVGEALARARNAAAALVAIGADQSRIEVGVAGIDLGGQGLLYLD